MELKITVHVGKRLEDVKGVGFHEYKKIKQGVCGDLQKPEFRSFLWFYKPIFQSRVATLSSIKMRFELNQIQPRN